MAKGKTHKKKIIDVQFSIGVYIIETFSIYKYVHVCILVYDMRTYKKNIINLKLNK